MAIIKKYVQPDALPDIKEQKENEYAANIWRYHYDENSSPIELDYDTETKLLTMFDPNTSESITGDEKMWGNMLTNVNKLNSYHAQIKYDFNVTDDIKDWAPLLKKMYLTVFQGMPKEDRHVLLQKNEDALQNLYGIKPKYNEVITGKTETERYADDHIDAWFVMTDKQKNFLHAHGETGNIELSYENRGQTTASGLMSPTRIAMTKIYNDKDSQLHIEKIPKGFWPTGFAVDNDNSLVIRYKQILPDAIARKEPDRYVSDLAVLRDKIQLTENLLHLLRTKDMEVFVNSLVDKKSDPVISIKSRGDMADTVFHIEKETNNKKEDSPAD